MPVGTTSRRVDGVRNMLRWGARLLILTFAALVVAAVTIVVIIPRATHGQAMTVLSGSMTPGIPVGSIVVVRPVDPMELRVGDVATYQAVPDRPVFITHRLFAISTVGGQTQFTFKGDANRVPDVKPVVAGQIRGELWFHVAYLGGIRDELKSGAGKLFILTVLLGGYALMQLAEGLRERRTAASKRSLKEVHRVEA
jgi:signal peptidase I